MYFQQIREISFPRKKTYTVLHTCTEGHWPKWYALVYHRHRSSILCMAHTRHSACTRRCLTSKVSPLSPVQWSIPATPFADCTLEHCKFCWWDSLAGIWMMLYVGKIGAPWGTLCVVDSSPGSKERPESNGLWLFPPAPHIICTKRALKEIESERLLLRANYQQTNSTWIELDWSGLVWAAQCAGFLTASACCYMFKFLWHVVLCACSDPLSDSMHHFGTGVLLKLLWLCG